jgi:hypothetical protein
LYSQFSSFLQSQISFFFHHPFSASIHGKKSCFRPVASTTICYFCGEKNLSQQIFFDNSISKKFPLISSICWLLPKCSELYVVLE